MTYNTWGSTQLEELRNNLGTEHRVYQPSRQAPWVTLPWIPEGGSQQEWENLHSTRLRHHLFSVFFSLSLSF